MKEPEDHGGPSGTYREQIENKSGTNQEHIGNKSGTNRERLFNVDQNFQ